jgi:hypothetical protein
MDTDEIKHFLITYDPISDGTDVRSFDVDYEAAQLAYREAEHGHQPGSKLDIVLLSAPSLETIEQTHSSYFSGKTVQLKELLRS